MCGYKLGLIVKLLQKQDQESAALPLENAHFKKMLIFQISILNNRNSLIRFRGVARNIFQDGLSQPYYFTDLDMTNVHSFASEFSQWSLVVLQQQVNRFIEMHL